MDFRSAQDFYKEPKTRTKGKKKVTKQKPQKQQPNPPPPKKKELTIKTIEEENPKDKSLCKGGGISQLFSYFKGIFSKNSPREKPKQQDTFSQGKRQKDTVSEKGQPQTGRELGTTTNGPETTGRSSNKILKAEESILDGSVLDERVKNKGEKRIDFDPLENTFCGEGNRNLDKNSALSNLSEKYSLAGSNSSSIRKILEGVSRIEPTAETSIQNQEPTATGQQLTKSRKGTERTQTMLSQNTLLTGFSGDKQLMKKLNEKETKSRGSQMSLDTVSWSPTAKDENEEHQMDIIDVIDQEDFPCLVNDFFSKKFDINEFNFFLDTFDLVSVMGTNLANHEQLVLLVGCKHFKEDKSVKEGFFVFTTSRMFLLEVVTDKALAETLSVEYKMVECIFFKDNLLILLIRGQEFLFPKKIFFHNTENPFLTCSLEEKTWNVIATIWQNILLKINHYVPIIHFDDEKEVLNLKLTSKHYIRNYFQALLAKYISMFDSSSIGEKIKPSKTGESSVAYTLFEPKGIEKKGAFYFSEKQVAFSRVLIQLTDKTLIIANLHLRSISCIKTSDIQRAYINHTRMLVILYVSREDKDPKKDHVIQKLVFFTHTTDSEEFLNFKPLYVKLIELGKSGKVNYDMHYSTFADLTEKEVLCGLPPLYEYAKPNLKSELQGINLGLGLGFVVKEDKVSHRTDLKSDLKSTSAQSHGTVKTERIKELEYQRDCCERFKKSCILF